MKINALHISAFGGIKNLSLDFNKNFNIIYGDNENGKTTVMSFIKMMFYGSVRGSAQIAKNIRKKYIRGVNVNGEKQDSSYQKRKKFAYELF